MRFINSFSTDAGFNLAAEEYLLKQGTEEVFRRNDNFVPVF